MNPKAILALENNTILYGISIGVEGICCGEVVFNTAITGYQEILTDPSYANQIVTLTFPHIGNVGINAEDQESNHIQASGLVVRNCSTIASNWRSEQTLDEYLKHNKIVAISEIDTRHLTQILREQGVMRGCIMTGKIDIEKALNLATSFEMPKGEHLIKKVSGLEPYAWRSGLWQSSLWKCGLQQSCLWQSEHAPLQKKSATHSKYRVLVYDFGAKRSILRYLVEYGCEVLVVPPSTRLNEREIEHWHPEGILLSNGPGDPADLSDYVEIIKELIKSGLPMFGICLGHQLLALAFSARTQKMKFGHHGANHPVFCLETGKVMVTSQNHGYVVEEETLPKELIMTHRSLFDGTLQGFRHLQKPIYSFQGHPEAGPGPSDTRFLFLPLIKMIQQKRERSTRDKIEARHYAETQ